jgi:hypothetical protein
MMSMRMGPQEDPHDTHDTLLYELEENHSAHVLFQQLYSSSCAICRRELDIMRGGMSSIQ